MTNGSFCWSCIFKIHETSSANMPSAEKRYGFSFHSAQSWSCYTVCSTMTKLTEIIYIDSHVSTEWGVFMYKIHWYTFTVRKTVLSISSAASKSQSRLKKEKKQKTKKTQWLLAKCVLTFPRVLFWVNSGSGASWVRGDAFSLGVLHLS